MHELLLRATASQGDASVMPRAMVVVAHPDDETIALGARLGRYKTARFVHVTDGAPRNQHDSRAHGFNTLDDYRFARQRELHKALDLAGIPADHLLSLGIPDQEASLRLVEITKTLARLLEEWQPEVILTHPYEGGHPDHDACAFAVHHAITQIRTERQPLIVEAAFYHVGSNGIEAGRFLPGAQPVEEARYELDTEEKQRKKELLACFYTQRETLKLFPVEQECFRAAPHYDFSIPAHRPPVLYDLHPWGVSSERFSELTREAEHQLRT